METKSLGLLIGLLSWGCSGTSLELGVLEGTGGGGAPAKSGKTADDDDKTSDGKNAPVATGGAGGSVAVGSSVGGAPDVGGSAAIGGSGSSAISPEFDGGDCEIAALPAASELTETLDTLPDPFTKLDGERIAEKSEWRCRRAELKRQAEVYALGPKPLWPGQVEAEVTTTRIEITLTMPNSSFRFDALVKLPTLGTAPYPAIIDFNDSSPLDESVLLDEHVAKIVIQPGKFGLDSGRPPRSGTFYDANPSLGATGTLLAWAWGVSRVIDAIEQSGTTLIDSHALGVAGCSRYGKGAFIAGAFDQRIALTLPFESGSAGVPAWRGVAQAEIGENGQPSQPLASVFAEQPWFGDAFEPFIAPGAIGRNPIDTHELVAMVAPRGLLVFDNPHIGELSAKYSHLALLAGAEVYGALGAGDNVGYISDVASGTHCAERPEWKEPLRAAIKKFLTKTETAALEIQPDAARAADLEEWRDWTTPSLD